MQYLLYAGTIWGGIQQPSWIAQPITAPVQHPPPLADDLLLVVIVGLL
jgi:hypothetical protein